MKMAPPPRPVPHSTRSPGTFVGAQRVEAALQVVELGAAHGRVGEERCRRPAVGASGPRRLRASASVRDLVVANRVAHLGRHQRAARG